MLSTARKGGAKAAGMISWPIKVGFKDFLSLYDKCAYTANKLSKAYHCLEDNGHGYFTWTRWSG